MTISGPSMLSPNGVLYQFFNGSPAANMGQHTLFAHPKKASDMAMDYLNAPTLVLTATGSGMLTLTGLPDTPDNVMTASSTQSWVSIAFPTQVFDSGVLSGLSLTAHGVNGQCSGDWALAVVATQPPQGGSDIDVLVIHPTVDVPLDPGQFVVITLSGIPSKDLAPFDTPAPGAFFWNEVVSEGGNNAATYPLFWTVSSAPMVEHGTAPLPLVASFTDATFSAATYDADFTSADIGRPAAAVYASSESWGTVLNNLAFAFRFSGAFGDIPTASGSRLMIGLAAADAMSTGIPFLGAANGMIDSTDLGSGATLSLPSGAGWNAAAPALNGPLLTWTISFDSETVFNFGSTAPIVAQVEAFLSETMADAGGSPPYSSACVVWWTGIPGFADACVTLPLVVLAPKPALVSLTLTPGTAAPARAPVTVGWVTYAAQSATLVQSGPSGACVHTVLSPPSRGLQPIPMANPFADPTDLNARSIDVSVTMVGGNDLSASSVPTTLSLALPQLENPPVAGTLSLAADGISMNTTYSIAVPLDWTACVATHVGTNTVSAIAYGGTTLSLTVPATGGALDLMVYGPGGPTTTANVEATVWAGLQPPAAGTILIFPYLPGATSPSLETGLYVWQPGYPVRPLSALVTDTPDPYAKEWNGMNLPQVVLMPPTPGAPQVVAWPSSDPTSYSTVTVSWNAPAEPSLALSASQTIWDASTLPTGAAGPVLVGGSGMQNYEAQTMPGMPNNGGPLYAIILQPTNHYGPALGVTFDSIPAGSVDSGQWGRCAAFFANAPTPGYVRASATYMTTPIPIVWSMPFLIMGDLPGGTTGLGKGLIVDASVTVDLNGLMPSDLDAVIQQNQIIVSACSAQGSWSLLAILYGAASTKFEVFPLGLTLPFPPSGSAQQSLVPVSVGRQSQTIYCVGGTLDGRTIASTNTSGIACYGVPNSATGIPSAAGSVPLFTLPASDLPFIPTLVAVEPMP